jgi:hypothetical protein
MWRVGTAKSDSRCRPKHQALTMLCREQLGDRTRVKAATIGVTSRTLEPSIAASRRAGDRVDADPVGGDRGG